MTRPGSAARAAVATVAFALTLGLVFVLVLALGGCGGGDGRTLVLYNGQHPQLTSALVAAFERQTGIGVRVRTDDSIVLASQILQEGSASAADVFLAENSPELTALDDRRLLARVDASTLAQIPAPHSGPTGDWIGVALRVGALVYDPTLLAASQLPGSLLQLAGPAWKGRVALAPTDSDFVPLISAVIARYGAATASRWLAGMKRNAQIFQTDEAVAAAVNRGDVASGLINSYYWYRLRLQQGQGAVHSAVYYFQNRDVGSVQNISGAAVLASSPHRARAQAFLRFLVSAQAQRLIARGDDFEYPARPGVGPNRALPALSKIAPATPSPAALGDGRQAARLIRASGLI